MTEDLPNLVQLRAFVAVVRSGGIRGAARRMGRTPSAISMALKQLEHSVGGPLFEGERKVRLTALGSFVQDEARGLLEHSERVALSIRSFAKDGAGRVDIACVPSVAIGFLPEAVRSLRERASPVAVQVRDIDTGAVLDAVNRGVVEVGVASNPTTSPGLSFSPLFSEPLNIVCADDDPLCGRAAPLGWPDIAGRTFITNGSYASLQTPSFLEIAARREVHVPNVTSLLAMIRARVGITLLPSLCRLQAGDDLAFLPVADPAARRVVGTVVRADRSLSPASLRLLASLRAAIAARAEDLGLSLLPRP